MANTYLVTCKPESDGHKRSIAVVAKNHEDAKDFVRTLGFVPAESKFVQYGDSERGRADPTASGTFIGGYLLCRNKYKNQ